jgi:hypothetical protein
MIFKLLFKHFNLVECREVFRLYFCNLALKFKILRIEFAYKFFELRLFLLERGFYRCSIFVGHISPSINIAEQTSNSYSTDPPVRAIRNSEACGFSLNS